MEMEIFSLEGVPASRRRSSALDSVDLPIEPPNVASKLGQLLAETGTDVEEDDLLDPPPIAGSSEVLAGSHHNRTIGESMEVKINDVYFRKSRRKTCDDFEHLKVLGTGAYGKVLLVRDRTTHELYAQKQLKKASIVIERRRVEQTMSERQILEAVRHPYIVKLHYAIQDSEKLYLLLQYAQGGELFTHLAQERMLSEDVASFYIAQMVCALHHLHSQGIVYRDLKPENCLLDEHGHLLLTDFGLSKIAEDDESCNSLLGTAEYMAPEVLLGKPYSYAVDWWSLGAVLHDLITGNPPFTGNNHKKIIDKITKQKLNLPYYLTEDAKDLLRRLLKKEPEKRLGHKQLDIIKKHRFFRKLDWKLIETRDPSLCPPIRPIVTDPVLAENFSTDFTNMVLSPPAMSTSDYSNQFQGFSYVGSHTMHMPLNSVSSSTMPLNSVSSST